MARIATAVDLEKINQADADLREGRVAEAIRALEEIVESCPEFEPSLRGLAYAYAKKERFIDASRMIERAFDIDASGASVKNASFFRCQIAFRILDGLPPNGDNNPA